MHKLRYTSSNCLSQLTSVNPQISVLRVIPLNFGLLVCCIHNGGGLGQNNIVAFLEHIISSKATVRSYSLRRISIIP